MLWFITFSYTSEGETSDSFGMCEPGIWSHGAHSISGDQVILKQDLSVSLVFTFR